MSQDCMMIGFAGVDKQDIVLYVARILYHLGKRVLIVDQSDSMAVKSSIPCPVELEKSMIEYRGMYFVNGRAYEEDLKESIHKYGFDYIIMDYGFGFEDEVLCRLDQVIYVIDQQKHNVERLIHMIDNKCGHISLVIRDAVGHKSGMRNLIRHPKLNSIHKNRIFIIYQDELDTICKIKCQYEIAFSFSKLSAPAQNTLKELTREIVPGLDKKTFLSAYSKAKRGD